MAREIEISPEQRELIYLVMDAKEKAKDRIIHSFIPDNPKAVPFPEQLKFFRDKAISRLIRAGNRSGKTFSTMRDLAWKITRTHPYRKKWKEDYKQSKPKVFWIVGPTYDFVDNTMWEMYLRNFIPDWYYTDDDGNEMITRTNQRHMDTVTFRNGDTIECKAYAQSDLAVMGRAIDDLTVDEMPRSLKLLSELMTRTFDRDGEVTMGFTPIVEDEDIKDYIESSTNVSKHSWSLLSNPHYRDNPERTARALAEWEHLPEPERNTRIRGDWYYERKGGRVFEGLEWDTIEDFAIPHEWRRCRVVDPASRITGYSEWAENPLSGQWICYVALEFNWKQNRATDTMILEEIIKLKPYPGFHYTLSLYDNAEAWFGSNGAKEGFIPCMLKNRAAAIMEMKRAVQTKRVAVFKRAGALLVKQTADYQFKADGTIEKKKDHVLDTAMYFIRQMPSKSQTPSRQLTEKDYLKAAFFEQKMKEASAPPPSRRSVYVRRFIRRTSR